jgi:hypothetical protein
VVQGVDPEFNPCTEKKKKKGKEKADTKGRSSQPTETFTCLPKQLMFEQGFEGCT